MIFLYPCRYDDPQIRWRLRVHQRCLRIFAGISLPLGGLVRPGANWERDHGTHVRTIYTAARMARMRATICSGATTCCRDHV